MRHRDALCFRQRVLLVVPAGSLDDEPTKTPDARIYCSEQAEWHKRGLMAPARERIRRALIFKTSPLN